MSAQRQFDLVLFGATGFTGGLTAEYLARHAPADLHWALAGRSRAKLDAVRARLAGLGPAVKQLALIEADASDPIALTQLAQSTKAIASTVGPYVHYGEPLVAACADAGTHYADLTGEPEFVDRMWLRYHTAAERSGAKLVHCCGFDSIPHDLGAYFSVRQLPANVPIKLEGFVRVRGQFSGGTYHSAINAFARLRESAQLLRQRRAAEKRAPGRRIGSTPQRIRFDSTQKSWQVPLPTIDPQVVCRSAAALECYGPDFRYGHFVSIRKLPQVAALLGGIGALFALAQIGPTRRWLLSKKQPGDGPSSEQRQASWFRVRFVGEGGGQRVVTEVRGGDPGYGETSKMLAESLLCLALDPLPQQGGQMTPAVAMGDALITRLQRAGIVFERIEET